MPKQTLTRWSWMRCVLGNFTKNDNARILIG